MVNCAETLKVDQDNLHMKFSVLDVSSNPIGSRVPHHESIKFGYSVQNVQCLPLSTDLARKWF